MNTPRELASWPEVAYPYPRHLKSSYYGGALFPRWCQTYEGRLLFCERMLTSRQIPHSGPVRNTFFFHELFLATQYLDAGYGALFFYRQVEDEACYHKACELLGSEAAARFITPNWEKGGRSPDLLVFDPRTGHFRFVECKGKHERFTQNQARRFLEIEDYLNHHLPPCGEPLSDPRHDSLLPALGAGRWMHVARLEPQ